MILSSTETCCCNNIANKLIKFDCNNIATKNDNISILLSAVALPYDSVSRSDINLISNDSIGDTALGLIAVSDNNKVFGISDMSTRSMALNMLIVGDVVESGDNVDVDWYVDITSNDGLVVPNLIGDFEERFEFIDNLMKDGDSDIQFHKLVSVNGVKLKLNMLVVGDVLSISSVEIINSDNTSTQKTVDGSNYSIVSPSFNTYKSYKSFAFVFLEELFSFKIKNFDDSTSVQMSLMICK